MTNYSLSRSWDSTYASELSNFTTNPTDEGTIWFSDSAAEEKILAYLTSEPVIPSPATWLDLGTGNGHLLFLLHNTLADEGKVGDKLVGVDYSDKSIELARSIAKERGLGADDVRFVMWDIMRDEPGASWVPKEGFGVVLDKGTFDAVSLSEEVGKDGGIVLEEYRRRVAELIRRGGLFLITSCNWTEKELWGIFEAGGGEFNDGYSGKRELITEQSLCIILQSSTHHSPLMGGRDRPYHRSVSSENWEVRESHPSEGLSFYSSELGTNIAITSHFFRSTTSSTPRSSFQALSFPSASLSKMISTTKPSSTAT